MLIKIYKNHSPTIIYQELLDLQLVLLLHNLKVPHSRFTKLFHGPKYDYVKEFMHGS
jgi:hypothetical protein